MKPRAPTRARNPSLATAPPSLPTAIFAKEAPTPPLDPATKRLEEELYLRNLEAREFKEEARHMEQAAAGYAKVAQSYRARGSIVRAKGISAEARAVEIAGGLAALREQLEGEKKAARADNIRKRLEELRVHAGTEGRAEMFRFMGHG